MSNSEVLVSFGGDSKLLKDSMDSASQVVSRATNDMKNSAEAANPAFVKLQESIDKLNESASQAAVAADALKSYADFAFYMKAAGSAIDVTSSSISLIYQESKSLSTGFIDLIKTVNGLQSSFLDYAATQAYVANYLPLVRVENDGLIASIGRASVAYNEYWRSVDVAKSGFVEISGATIAAAGNMDKFTNAVKSIGFGSSTEAIRSLTTKLLEVKNMSADTAASIISSFGSIPTISGPLLRSLVDVTTQLSSTSDQAKLLSEALANAMTNPATAGEAFLTSQRDITAELLNQFDIFKRRNDVYGMQSVILQEMITKERNAGVEKQRVLREELEAMKSLGTFGNLLGAAKQKEIDATNKAVDALDKQLDGLRKNAAQIQETTLDFNQAAIAASNIVKELNPLSNQLDTLNSKIGLMEKGFGNAGSKLKSSTGDAAELLRTFEQFNGKAYWDESKDPSKSHWAVGYGTHKMSDGSEVTESSTMTREQAEQNLAQRVIEFQTAAAKEIGEAWNSLSDKTRASITSVTYNYGHVPQSVQAAAETGSDQLVAKAISALASNPERRRQEAANITGEGLGSNAKPITVANEEALNKEKDAAQALNNAIAGGNAVALAQADILKRNADGHKDEVKDAQQLVAAWKTDLANAYQKTTQLTAQNGLDQARVSLAEKMLAVTRSKAVIESQGDVTAKEKLDSANKIADIELKAAGDDVALQNAALMKKKAAQTTYEQEITSLAKEAENSRYNILMASFEARKAKISQDVTSHNISNTQKLQADLALEAEQTAIEKDHIEKLKALEIEGTLAYQKQQDALTLITAQSSAKREQIIAQDNRKIQQSYDQIANQMSSSITSGIMGMIQGTTSFKQFMQNMALQVVQMFVKAGVDMAVHWAEKQILMTMTTIGAQTAQTAAVGAGTAAKLATVTSGAIAGAAIEKAGHMATVSGDASTAAAGAYASVVQIPIIGPILAPAAAATAFSAVEAFGSFDVGSYRVPHDQLAMIHQNEMIIPSRGGVADEFRSMLNGDSSGLSGGGDSHYHFHGAIMDARSIAKVVANQFDSNPSSRPKY